MFLQVNFYLFSYISETSLTSHRVQTNIFSSFILISYWYKIVSRQIEAKMISPDTSGASHSESNNFLNKPWASIFFSGQKQFTW